MKAIVWTKYGPPDVLQLQEVEKPSPKNNELLIKIFATTVSAGDCEMRNLKFPIWIRFPMRVYVGLRKPRRITILGQEIAGEIEAVGKDVKLWKKGDQVFGTTSGFRMGGHAEYLSLPEDSKDGVLALKPSNMSYEEATTIPVGGLNALHFLRKGNIQPGQKVLINGAGGCIGTMAIQIAKSYYGAHVTAVDSTDKLDMLRSIGADKVLDYTKVDFWDQNGESYDVILDVVGKSSYSGCLNSLTKGGIFIIANPTLFRIIRGVWTSKTSSKKVITRLASYNVDDMTFLRELIEAGTIKSVVDKRYPLEQTAEAHRYVETGRKKGNVVIIIDHIRE
ncbi:MAG: NAD(P)-dependent alcohol dehydrogenase [Candidatus Hodarchaeales archaeon]|jgi:NADPH:quinone reductase-like Zn-dependent oxidoreductase